MPIFLEIFALFLLGTCAIVSSPVPAGKGKGIVLFLLGVAFWAGAYIIVRTNQEVLKDFLLSDYAFSGALANQTMASFVVYGLGWYIFVSTSAKSEVKRSKLSEYERLISDEPEEREVRVFRLLPGILIWIPVVVLLAGIWFVPAHFGGLGFESTVTPTPTITATNSPTATSTKTPTAMATSTPTATQTSIATPTSTSIATATPEPTATQVATSTNPNMPPLACGGEWLHDEPFMLGVVEHAFERCPDGEIVLHYTNYNMQPERPFSGMSVWGKRVSQLIFTIEDANVYVNGQPLNEWLALGGDN